MERRTFLKNASAATLAACFPASLSGIERVSAAGRIERRSLGRTGQSLSMIGFGGIVVMNATPEEASARVAHAIDRGINYFDVAPSYVFLACKTQQRTRAGATAELESSLRHMQTDHFDLYQMHAMTTMADVERVFAKDGAIEAFEAARTAGKVRFLGFSAHSVEAALALMDRYAFDTILFPVNFATWHAGNFGPQVLETAQRKKMGILALKAMARRPWPEGAKRTHAKCWYEPLDDPEAARDGLRFTLSHPVTAAIPPGDENLFAMALDLAADFKPLTAAEAEAIKQKGVATTPLFKA
jgi:predicted aldo/keto reductase-like oxidoreductase